MTQQHEDLSALVDGEALGSEELLNNTEAVRKKRSDFVKSISTDPLLSAKWRSYHLTKDLLRNDMSSDVNFDISDRIALALEDELPILAPKPSWRELPVVSAVLPIIRQSGQLAMVACVTAMVIFGVQTYNKPEVTDPFTTAAPRIGPQGGLAPVSLQSSQSTQQDRMNQLLEQRRHINALIQDHVRQQRMRNFSSSDAINGVNGDEIDGSENNGANPK